MRTWKLLAAAGLVLAGASAFGANAGGKYGHLGIGVGGVPEALTDQLGLQRGEGVLVTRVKEGSPASEGGIQKNDVITRVDNQIILSTEQLRKLIGYTAPGIEVKIELIRRTKRQTVRVKLGATDQAPVTDRALPGFLGDDPTDRVMIMRRGPEEDAGTIRIRGPNGEMLTFQVRGHKALREKLEELLEKGLIDKGTMAHLRKMGFGGDDDVQKADKAFGRQLQKPVSFDFQDTPVVQALIFLRSICHADLVIDPKLRERNPKVTLRVNQMLSRDAIKWLVELADAKFATANRTMCVGGPEFVKRFKALEPLSVPPGAELPALKAALEKPVSFDFVNTKLEDAVQFLRKLLGANLILGPEAQGRRFHLKLNKAPAGLALAYVGLMTDCDVIVKQGAVLFVPREEKEAGEGEAPAEPAAPEEAE
ncbi:MAG: S1C family serine protease [Planctomycetota bacterium]